MGIRLMIIELRKYNEIRELLIGDRVTELQAQVSYQDEVWEASVTRVAVHMGVEETGCEQGTGVHAISLQVGIQIRDACRHCRAIKKH